jgi:hypothetical protein
MTKKSTPKIEESSTTPEESTPKNEENPGELLGQANESEKMDAGNKSKLLIFF